MSAKRHLLGATAAATFATGLLAPAQAQEEIAPINSGNVALTVGFDVVTEYWFRGIDQGTANRQGFIWQPYIDVGFDLWSYEDFSLGYYFGTWNSFTTGSVSGDGFSSWYESDIYTGFAIGLPLGFSIDFGYTLLYSPGLGTTFSQEIYVGAAYDDSWFWADNGLDHWSFAGLQPYVYFAIEVEGSSDGGSNDGTYGEFGIEPSIVLPISPDDYPISFSVPVAVGISVADFYEVQADGGDSTFGFVSVSFMFGVPLPFIPAEYGAWEATAGVQLLILGNDLRNFSATGDDVVPIGIFGLSLSY